MSKTNFLLIFEYTSFLCCVPPFFVFEYTSFLCCVPPFFVFEYTSFLCCVPPLCSLLISVIIESSSALNAFIFFEVFL